MCKTEGRVSNKPIIPHLHFHLCLFRVLLQLIPAWFDSSAPQRHPSPAARLHFQVPQRNLPLHPNIVEEGKGRGGSSRWEATGPRAKQTYLLLSHRFFWSLRRSPSSLFSCLSVAQRFIWSAVNSSSQRATLGSSGWELLKALWLQTKVRLGVRQRLWWLPWQCPLLSAQNEARTNRKRVGNLFDNTMCKHAKPLRLLCFLRAQLGVDLGGIRIFSHKHSTYFYRTSKAWGKSVQLIGSWTVSGEDGALPWRQRAKLIRNANKHIDRLDYLHCLSGWSWD